MSETFTLSDLKNRTGDVLHAADREPQRLTRRGQARYVLLRVEDFDKMTATPPSPRRVFRTGEEPAELAAFLFSDFPEPFDAEEAEQIMGSGTVPVSEDETEEEHA